MSHVKVHIFDPVLYPRLLYIVKGKNLMEGIKDAFRMPNGDSLNMEGSGGCRAGVWRVQLDSDNKLGVLVWLREKVDVSVVAHESVHAANIIFEDCDIDYTTSHDEHFAHLVGFVADCIWQVFTGKYKD